MARLSTLSGTDGQLGVPAEPVQGYQPQLNALREPAGQGGLSSLQKFTLLKPTSPGPDNRESSAQKVLVCIIC